MTFKEEETEKKKILSVTAKRQGRKCYECGGPHYGVDCPHVARIYNLNGWRTSRTSEEERQGQRRHQNTEEPHRKNSVDTTNMTEKKKNRKGRTQCPRENEKEDGGEEKKDKEDQNLKIKLNLQDKDPKEEEERQYRRRYTAEANPSKREKEERGRMGRNRANEDQRRCEERKEDDIREGGEKVCPRQRETRENGRRGTVAQEADTPQDCVQEEQGKEQHNTCASKRRRRRNVEKEGEEREGEGAGHAATQGRQQVRGRLDENESTIRRGMKDRKQHERRRKENPMGVGNGAEQGGTTMREPARGDVRTKRNTRSRMKGKLQRPARTRKAADRREGSPRLEHMTPHRQQARATGGDHIAVGRENARADDSNDAHRGPGREAN